MSDEALRDVYARIMRERDAAGRTNAVPIEAMQALLEKRGSDEERVRTLDAIMRDQDARADFEILRSAYEAAPPARASSMSSSYALAAALVLMIGAGFWFRSRSPQPDTARGSSTPEVMVVSPGESIASSAPVRFVWRARPDAKLYSLQVVDTDGGVAYTALTPDTVAILPDSVRLVAGKEYRWWVEANRSVGATVKSAVKPLRVEAR